MEYNKEDYLDSSLTLFSHYSSSSKDGGVVKQFRRLRIFYGYVL